MSATRSAIRPAREVVVVWSLVALMLVAVLVTYARLPPRLLYHVTGTGIRAGLGQTGKLVSFHNAPHPAVHHGVHHGLQGLLLVVGAAAYAFWFRINAGSGTVVGP